MLPKNIFDERMAKCHGCSEWNRAYSACLRGHKANSPTGCPMKKFAPVFNAAYDADVGRVLVLRDLPSCDGCGK